MTYHFGNFPLSKEGNQDSVCSSFAGEFCWPPFLIGYNMQIFIEKLLPKVVRAGGTKYYHPQQPGCRVLIWLVVSNIFYFHLYLGKGSNLTNIFPTG